MIAMISCRTNNTSIVNFITRELLFPRSKICYSSAYSSTSSVPFCKQIETILQVTVANTKIGILVEVKIPNEDFTDWRLVIRMEMLEVEMEVDNVANVVAEMVGDMEVDRVADEPDMLVANVAEEVTDTAETSVEMAGVKCV